MGRGRAKFRRGTWEGVQDEDRDQRQLRHHDPDQGRPGEAPPAAPAARPNAKVPRMDTYKKLSSDDIWLQMVGQVCVMGSARGMERIESEPGLRQDVKRATALSFWKKRGFESDHMASVLREFKATKFNVEAAKKLRVLVDAPSSFKGTRVVLLDDLPRGRGTS